MYRPGFTADPGLGWHRICLFADDYGKYDVMKKNVTACSWLTGAALFSLFVTSGAWAADISRLAESCAGCHGKDGVSHESDVPIIAGYSSPYIGDSLTAYRKKEQACPEIKYRDGNKKGEKTDMCRVAEALSDADIAQLGKYFAGKKFVRAQQTFDSALAQKGAQIHERSCEKCHTEGGSQASDDSGILAGQWMPYLKEVFTELSTGKRPMSKKMKPKIDSLQPEDFDALANYYASFK